MEDLFQLRITIPGFPVSIRVASYSVAVIFIIIGIYKQRHMKRQKIYNLVNTFALLCLAHIVYETIWITLLSPYSTRNELLLYVLTIFILIEMVSLLNLRHNFLKFNRLFLVFYGLFFVIVGVMYFTGWFYRLQLWFDGDGSNPESILWFMSKAFGLLSWLLLIR